MANSYGTVVVGDFVSYLPASPTPIRWRAVKVTGVVSQTSLNLAYVGPTGTRVAINGGAAVARRTNGTQVDVWRRF